MSKAIENFFMTALLLCFMGIGRIVFGNADEYLRGE